MKTPTQDELKEFCQLAGVHWHEPKEGHCKCLLCNEFYDVKNGEGVFGISHGFCSRDCVDKYLLNKTE